MPCSADDPHMLYTHTQRTPLLTHTPEKRLSNWGGRVPTTPDRHTHTCTHRRMPLNDTSRKEQLMQSVRGRFGHTAAASTAVLTPPIGGYTFLHSAGHLLSHVSYRIHSLVSLLGRCCCGCGLAGKGVRPSFPYTRISKTCACGMPLVALTTSRRDSTPTFCGSICAICRATLCLRFLWKLPWTVMTWRHWSSAPAASRASME
mmetsp:Transcript_44661/g.126210  ORF Transcript_44661/g.126210 Transcript_44661/m.126210 type:complete len:203 (+) Transcript_44661:371-979(+)